MSGIKKKTIISAVIVNAVLVVAAILLANLNRSNLIIYFGVKGADMLIITGWVVFGLLAVILNAWWILLSRRDRKKSNPAPSVTLQYTPSGRIDTDDVRAELEKYRIQRPTLAAYMERAIEQMDSMDRKQDKLKELFTRNQVDSLGDVDATLDDTEQAMCSNLIKIINRAILWDPLEWDKPEKKDVYAGHTAYILQMLERNDDVLLMCDRLLSETVSYVDEKSTKPDASKMHLEVMTETIQSLRKLNTSNDFGG